VAILLQMILVETITLVSVSALFFWIHRWFALNSIKCGFQSGYATSTRGMCHFSKQL